MSSTQKRKRSPSPSLTDPSITQSQPITDRSSTFTAYFSPTLTPQGLQTLPQISSASHRILAWRRGSNQQSITGSPTFVSGHDDDGEKYAGKRLEKVLEELDVVGACVVARWYGGVLLGPVRFTHIEECAREAVKEWQRVESEGKAKRRKEEEDGVEKIKLEKVLGERDRSIAVLRGLAAEKEDEVRQGRRTEGKSEEVGDAMESSDGAAMDGEMKRKRGENKLVIDYSAMSVEQLRKLEKARDATLSFLLKRIDNAEAEMSRSNSNDAKTST